MARILYATLAALVGAALIHLAIVLMLPQLSANDVWRQIESNTQLNTPMRLDHAANGVEIAAARSLDPLFAVIACRYDLADGVFSITAPGTSDFWSVAVFDDYGRILFSANDRIVASDDLDLAVALPLQMRALQQTPRAEYAQAVLAESERNEGFVVIRIFRPDNTWEPVVEDFIDNVECSANPL
ncbi:MAG: membrane protein [Oricola sp.]